MTMGTTPRKVSKFPKSRRLGRAIGALKFQKYKRKKLVTEAAKAAGTHIEPQPGPQYEFLSTLADIAIYGGAAGGGKSFGLCLEPLRHIYNPLFGGVIFRRNTTQVRNEGGLWDEAKGLYPKFGASLKDTTLEVRFLSGARVKFSHLEHENTVYDWQGAQIPFIGFDELTHFSRSQFFYMLSRNRSASGVPGYIRATTNPDADSWVKKFIQWWIDPINGLAIPERSGVLRYFVRDGDEIIWGDSVKELKQKFPESLPKSVTFISAKLEDNQILMKKDPSYLANLLALSNVERKRLRDGNWNVRPTAGTVYKRHWFQIVDAAPAEYESEIRYWDRAATEPHEKNPDPAYTAGLKLRRADGVYYICDVARDRVRPLGVQSMVSNTAGQDGRLTRIGIEGDPGQAGVAEAETYVRLLSGYDVRVYKATKDKVTRSLPASAQAEGGNIKIVRGEWNDALLTELENFPDSAHKDQCDALSGAFNALNENVVGTMTPRMAEAYRPAASNTPTW